MVCVRALVAGWSEVDLPQQVGGAWLAAPTPFVRSDRFCLARLPYAPGSSHSSSSDDPAVRNVAHSTGHSSFGVEYPSPSGLLAACKGIQGTSLGTSLLQVASYAGIEDGCGIPSWTAAVVHMSACVHTRIPPCTFCSGVTLLGLRHICFS